MNYAEIILDELEDGAQREVTPELIEELSKRVWEAQGNCAHRSEITWERNDGEMFLRCENKECLTLKDVPDITDPAVWGPLFCSNDKLLNIRKEHVNGHWSLKDVIRYQITYQNPHDGSRWTIKHEDPGVAVGLAILKIKEMESD
jgi:hypothetical protein